MFKSPGATSFKTLERKESFLFPIIIGFNLFERAVDNWYAPLPLEVFC
jgi:hypothetical protein